MPFFDYKCHKSKHKKLKSSLTSKKIENYFTKLIIRKY